MDTIQLVIVMAVAIVLSFIALHSWVFLCDCIVGGLKKIFHIGKKEKRNWHTLDGPTQTRTDSEIERTESVVTENGRIY